MEEKISTKAYIDLSGVSDFLKDNTSPSENAVRQILEEVVFLCINENFLKDVQSIRKIISIAYPNITLPISSAPIVEDFVRLLYTKFYVIYTSLMEDLIKKYKLIPSIYWRNKLELIDSCIWCRIYKSKDGHETHPPMKYMEDRAIRINRALKNLPLGLMDNIILRNSPIPKDDNFPLWANPYFTRSRYEGFPLSMRIDENPHQTMLNIGFPAYASLSEMITILRDNFNEIQKFRSEQLPIPNRKDARKNEIGKSIDAYTMSMDGLGLTKIANKLDIKYGGDYTFEGVQKLIKRMKDESKRFDKRLE